MSDKQLLEKIGEMIVANNSTLLDAVDEKIKISEKRVITQLEKK